MNSEKKLHMIYEGLLCRGSRIHFHAADTLIFFEKRGCQILQMALKPFERQEVFFAPDTITSFERALKIPALTF